MLCCAIQGPGIKSSPSQEPNTQPWLGLVLAYYWPGLISGWSHSRSDFRYNLIRVHSKKCAHLHTLLVQISDAFVLVF